MNSYVGNLAYSLGEEDLRKEFGGYGEVSSVKLIVDHETGKSKGFAFVEMANDEEAEKAIAALDGMELDSREIKVNKARPKPQRDEGYAKRY